MSGSEESLREALSKIAEIASAAAHGTESRGNSHGEASATGGEEMPSCGIKTVPKRLAVKAALVKKSGGRVFQTDTPELVAPAAGDAEWADFIQRTRISDLYFEYEVHDR